jgi:hypothetical protein
LFKPRLRKSPFSHQPRRDGRGKSMSAHLIDSEGNHHAST